MEKKSTNLLFKFKNFRILNFKFNNRLNKFSKIMDKKHKI